MRQVFDFKMIVLLIDRKKIPHDSYPQTTITVSKEKSALLKEWIDRQQTSRKHRLLFLQNTE